MDWDKLREHAATLQIYYILKIYDNDEIRCFKDRLDKDQEKAIASFTNRYSNENVVLIDEEGLVIASIQSPEKIGTKPFEHVDFHPTKAHEGKSKIELAWRAINRIPDHHHL